MDEVLKKQFQAEQKITIRNPKDNRVITRSWRQASHLVDRGWKIIGSEGEGIVKKSLENKDASPVASVTVNNPDLFNLDELKVKYKDLTGRTAHYKWDKDKILEKIKEHGKKD